MWDENRITIRDIAENLGVSTATVSNVIHGKTKKVSKQTMELVQKSLEESGYIPNMAAVLLAQNSSKIVCVVLSSDEKYKGHMISDPFISGILNGLSKYLDAEGYFMMIKEEQDIDKIVQYASMWNMAGIILVGYCENNYDDLRRKIRIPLVVIDGYFENIEDCANIGIDNYNGGYKAGSYLIKNGHKKIMFLSDNDLCGDHERYSGFIKALEDNNIECLAEDFKHLPVNKKVRYDYYNILLSQLHNYSAAFCASDVYAIEFMNYLIDHGVKIPDDLSIIGFDNIKECEIVRPRLTTIKQDINARAKAACEVLDELINKKKDVKNIILPVEIVERDSVEKLDYRTK